MKKIALKSYGKIISLLMSLFGFILGCGTGIDPVAEYGVPSADFKVKGTVKSAVTGKGISNIRVIVKEPYSMKGDTTYTAVSGDYSMEVKHIIGFPVTLYADDVDDTVNGEYKSDSLVVNWDDVTRIKEGDNNWYDGVYEKKDANFHLKSPEATAMYGVRPVGETD
ncbi:MAG: radical SAM-associated putative lipoprotein [Proteiniphilum sp.]|nr:radical SAM-associated putative lipoprotein [Proteiniphilum sp.]